MLPPTLNEQPLLLLSPHCDDAVLSCAALIARERPIEILTVFTGAPEPPLQSAWDRRTGFANSAASTIARRAEEEAAFSPTPHELRFLDLLETEYLDRPRQDADGQTVAAAVAEWLRGHEGGLVAVPAGAGWRPSRVLTRLRRLAGRDTRIHHPDHLFVRDVALDVALSHRARGRALLYEELPYSWARPADIEVRKLARRYAASASLVVASIDRDEKAARIAVYKSQTPHLGAGARRVDVAEHLPAEERYWILEK